MLLGIEIVNKSVEHSKLQSILIDIALLKHPLLSAPEALIVYLHEEQRLRFTHIAQALNRDNRTIWTQYNRAIQKLQGKFYRQEESTISIPLSAFLDRRLSFTEAVISHLREQGQKNKDIAQHLGKDQRSIALLYSRAKKKLRGETA